MNFHTTPFSEKNAQDSPGFVLWQVTAIWQRKIANALKPFGLTQVQYAILASILWLSKHESEITQASLARHAKLDPMMTSQVVRALEKKKLLERRPHSKDTRAHSLVLTKKGEDLIWKAIPVVEQEDRLFFQRLQGTEKQLHTLLCCLIEV